MTSSRKVALVGASGYVGLELDALVEGHPSLELDVRMSARPDFVPAADEPGLRAPVEPLDPGRFAGLDGVFLCTPHGTAAPLARAALAAGCVVVDASADFRLRDPGVFASVYGQRHPAPELLARAVYGLTERAREQVAGARLIANPGCYPTSILLPLLPLIEAGALDDLAPIVCDSKSGVSGAGKTPTATTHFGSVHENFKAYGVGTHRHAPEIWQAAGTQRIVFVPHLLPVFRGILSTLYLTPRAGVGADQVHAILAAAYAAEPFVLVRAQSLPELADVRHTNRCDIGVAAVGSQIIVVSCIDNLLKGAAGQALQNMNLALGLEETAGLPGARPLGRPVEAAS